SGQPPGADRPAVASLLLPHLRSGLHLYTAASPRPPAVHDRRRRALSAARRPSGDRGAPNRRLPHAHRAPDRLLQRPAQAREHRRPDVGRRGARRHHPPAQRAAQGGGLAVIIYKSPAEIDLMREAGAILGEALAHLQSMARPGVTLLDLGRDAGLIHRGFWADAGLTVGVGKISPQAQRLMDVTRASLSIGIEQAHVGNRIGDISAAVQQHVEHDGFSVVRSFVGHGIGRDMHEDPQVPNFGIAGTGPLLKPGMVLAIEPMVNAGGPDVALLGDGWTVVTVDQSLSAYFE